MFSYRISSRIFEHSQFLVTRKRCYSELKCVNLVGRDFVNPQDYSCDELKFLLWTALDLKHKFLGRKYHPLDLLNNHTATIIATIPNVKYQVAMANAVKLLGAAENVVVDKRWYTSTNVCDLGRCLSGMSSIILARSESCELMYRLRDGAYIPVISIACGMFKPLQGLADMLTIYEHFGRLKGLRVGWVGPPREVFNSYLIMCPKLGMNLQFACSCEPELPKTPLLFNTAAQNCVEFNTEISQYTTVEDAIYRADVITTTLHEMCNMCITRKLAKEAAVDWIFLHELPRTRNEVEDDVFYSENSKAFEASSNLVWVTMAVVLQALKEYRPVMEMPTFDAHSVFKC